MSRRDWRRSRSRSSDYSRRRRDYRHDDSSRNRPSRRRYDSPPKESAVIANMYGLTDDPATYTKVSELNAAASAAAASARHEQDLQSKELYIGNLPPSTAIFALIDRINDVLVEMGATVMAGKPIVSGWLGGDGQFAFVHFRTAEECNNALSLNGFVLDGHQLKVGKPKSGGMQAIAYTAPVSGRATQFSLDESVGLGLVVQPPLPESTKTAILALVGAPTSAPSEVLERLVSETGDLKSVRRIDNEILDRSTLIFEYKDASSQRKISGKRLVYDRDFPLAVVRIDEAVSAGFVDADPDGFTTIIGRNTVPRPSRVVWIVGFPAIAPGMEVELLKEVRFECERIGTVGSVDLRKVSKDKLECIDLMAPLNESELVAIVEFDSIDHAKKCKRYLSGPKCYYLDEEVFAAKAYDKFTECILPRSAESTEPIETPFMTPSVVSGKIVSVEASIMATSRAKKKVKIAPEDLDIID